jgi:hypothetical protein
VQALAHGSLRRPSGGLPKLSMSAPVASVAVRRVRGKLGASRLNGSCSAYTSGDQLSPAGCPSRTPSHHGTNRSVPLESPGSTHELISPLTCGLCGSQARRGGTGVRSPRTLRRFTTGSLSSAYRLSSDQLGDYGVDGPYIQPHIHGLSSPSVPDFDDSPTVLGDEEVSAAAA